MGTSTLITRMTSDINQVQSGINMTLRLLLRSPFVVFGAMVMAFTVDVRSAFVFVVTIPVLCVVVFGIMAVSMPLYKSVQRQLDKVLLTTRENLLGSVSSVPLTDRKARRRNLTGKTETWSGCRCLWERYPPC